MRILRSLLSQLEYRQSTLGFLVGAILLVAFLASGIREEVSLENLHRLGENPWTPALIIIAMTGAWMFALPASAFFFIAPLLFPPVVATAIICAGSALGTLAGYLVARFVGGPWIERFRNHRITRLLHHHSSFATLFAIRVFPSSPHGWINYAAGLLKLPIATFLIATLLGVGIKAFLYSVAIAESVGAKSVRDALSWQTVGTLLILTVISLLGHFLWQRWEKELPQSD